MFYIYHIPERNKIGATDNLKVRMQKHAWKGFYEILEEHTTKPDASRREIELQDEYGYERDPHTYEHTTSIATPQSRSKGGKVPSNWLRKLDYEKAQYIRAQYKRVTDIFDKKITQRRLAKVFNIEQQNIWLILNNKTYTTP